MTPPCAALNASRVVAAMYASRASNGKLAIPATRKVQRGRPPPPPAHPPRSPPDPPRRKSEPRGERLRHDDGRLDLPGQPGSRDQLPDALAREIRGANQLETDRRPARLRNDRRLGPHNRDRRDLRQSANLIDELPRLLHRQPRKRK